VATCGVALTASLIFHGSHHLDGTASLPQPLTFRVPGALPITAGASKNGRASLAFGHGGHSTITCEYAQHNAASSFSFTSCGNGATAGALEHATDFVLHIERADRGAGASGYHVQVTVDLTAPDGIVCAGSTDVCTEFVCQSGACIGIDPFEPPKSCSPQTKYVPQVCTSLAGAEGRCLSTCLPAVAARSDELPQNTCSAGDKCVPCFDPSAANPNAPTGACSFGCDHPKQPPTVLTCPWTGPAVFSPAGFPDCSPACGGAHCMPSSLVPPGEQGFLAACPGGFC
jgi:hypothetical protein